MQVLSEDLVSLIALTIKLDNTITYPIFSQQNISEIYHKL